MPEETIRHRKHSQQLYLLFSVTECVFSALPMYKAESKFSCTRSPGASTTPASPPSTHNRASRSYLRSVHGCWASDCCGKLFCMMWEISSIQHVEVMRNQPWISAIPLLISVIPNHGLDNRSTFFAFIEQVSMYPCRMFPSVDYSVDLIFDQHFSCVILCM